MRDEIPVTEQEEAAWREMERRQQQAARPAAPPSAGQVLTDEEIAACYSAARPAGARRSGTTYAICRAVEAAVLAKLQLPSGQSAAPTRIERKIYRETAEHYEYLAARFPAGGHPGRSFPWDGHRWVYEVTSFDDTGDYDLIWRPGEIAKPAAATVPADERETFEAAHRRAFSRRVVVAGYEDSPYKKTAAGDYADQDVNDEWVMWQARAALAAPAAPNEDEGTLTALYDMFSIGALAREPHILLENVRNAYRRSRCLSAVERTLTVPVPPEPEDDGVWGEESLLNWGADQQGYAEHFKAALAEFQRHTAPAVQAAPLATVKESLQVATPQPAAQAAPSELADAVQFACDVLAELYAKHQTKIGPFASQAQLANVRLRSALTTQGAGDAR